MKQTKVFEAEDGTQFATPEECEQYEEKNFVALFVNLTSLDVRNAIDRNDARLADAFERAGVIIAKKRRASGELKRAKKSSADASIEDVAKAMKTVRPPSNP